MNNMASKNLTHIFMIMRDKAIQRRNMYKREDSEEICSDRVTLMSNEDFESTVGNSGLPEWTHKVEEVQYNISTLKEKTKKLTALHNNLIRCPNFEDNPDEEKQLATLTNEIKRSLERCQMLMIQIQKVRTRGKEHTLNENVVKSLAFNLQEVKTEFIQTCTSYVNSMSNVKKNSSFLVDSTNVEDDDDYGTFEEGAAQSKVWTQEQMLFLEDNTIQIQERDRAVQKVVKSTIELNELFQGIAQIVHDQGTILDRIDFNIENASIQVESGAQQLRKAERHQRKGRHMACILGLAAAIVFMLILIILTKT